MAVHSTGQFAYVANFGSDYQGTDGSISAYTVDPTSGALTEMPDSPYLTGGGPESVCVHASGQFLYLARSAQPSISVFAIDPASGALTEIEGSPFATQQWPTDLACDPNGQFQYAANSFHQSISVFSIDPMSGAVAPVAGSPFQTGVGPTSVAVVPTGQFIYVTNKPCEVPNCGGNLYAYSVDASTGALTPLPGSPFPTGDGAWAVAIDGTGQLAYVANFYSKNISAYRIDAGTGIVTEIAGSPFPTGQTPVSVVITGGQTGR